MKYLVSLLFFVVITPLQAGYIGTYAGNDNTTRVSEITGEPLMQVGKIEIQGDNLIYEGDGDEFEITFKPLRSDGSWFDTQYFLAAQANGRTLMSGTVTNNGDHDVVYFAAKAGNGFNLYSWQEDVETWSTHNLCADLSHMSFYVNNMPEPAGFVWLPLLLLTGTKWFRRMS